MYNNFHTAICLKFNPGVSFFPVPADISHITPNKPQYIPGDTLNCSGDANPPVSYYKWEDVTTNTTEVIQEGATANMLTVKEEWVGQVLTLRCSLTNQMRDGDQTESVEIDLTVIGK